MRLRCRDTMVRVSNVETSGVRYSAESSFGTLLLAQTLPGPGSQMWWPLGGRELRHGGTWAQVLSTDILGLQMHS